MNRKKNGQNETVIGKTKFASTKDKIDKNSDQTKST